LGHGGVASGGDGREGDGWGEIDHVVHGTRVQGGAI
jgi:hypothetical protein